MEFECAAVIRTYVATEGSKVVAGKKTTQSNANKCACETKLIKQTLSDSSPIIALVLEASGVVNNNKPSKELQCNTS